MHTNKEGKGLAIKDHSFYDSTGEDHEVTTLSLARGPVLLPFAIWVDESISSGANGCQQRVVDCALKIIFRQNAAWWS